MALRDAELESSHCLGLGRRSASASLSGGHGAGLDGRQIPELNRRHGLKLARIEAKAGRGGISFSEEPSQLSSTPRTNRLPPSTEHFRAARYTRGADHR